MVPEGTQSPVIGRDGVIVEEAGDDLSEPNPLDGDRLMPSPPQLLLDVLELRPHPVAPGLAHELELALAGLAADEGEAEEVEGFRFAKGAPGPFGRRVASERNQAGLLRMKRQRESVEPS